MNRLQLVAKLHEKCGIGGSAPTTTIDRSGEARRLVNWIDEAWSDIQGLKADWFWMRGDFSFQAVVGQRVYTPTQAGAPDVKTWRHETLRCYQTSAGRSTEQRLVDWSYDEWRDVYDFGTMANATGRPTVFAVRPRDKALLLAATPDQAYTVYGEYQRLPSGLVADTDVPALPIEHHWLIVYRAMMLYANYEAAPEVRFDGEEGYNRVMKSLMKDQLPPFEFGGPLA